jgi:hypothetical protein
LSGIGIDAARTVHKLEPFEIYAHFDDGEVKEFSPPRTLLTLKVPSAGPFPKACGVTFLLAETGGGGTGHRDATEQAYAEAVREVQKADAAGDVAGQAATALAIYLLQVLAEFIGKQIKSRRRVMPDTS